MHDPVRSFLDWYDGWSDNVEGAPSEKQWQRFQDRLKRMQQECEAQPVTVASAPIAAIVAANPAHVPTTGVMPASPPPEHLVDLYKGNEYLALAAAGNEKEAKRKWRLAFAGALMELDASVDPRTAKEMAESDAADLEVNPREAAKREIASWVT